MPAELLKKAGDSPRISLDQAFCQRRSIRNFQDRPISLSAVSRLISLAADRVDAEGHRAAPSAHALYPIEVRVTAGHVQGLDKGVWAARGQQSEWQEVVAGDQRGVLSSAAIGDQPWVHEAASVITLCADMAVCERAFADQPPAPERGRRYAWIEAGAIAQNIALLAATLGLGSVLVAGFDDAATGRVLGLAGFYQPLLHLCLDLPNHG